MRPGEFYKSDHHRWALSIILALLLQVVAFSFWAGTLTGRVAAMTNAIEHLQAEVTAMIPKR